MPTDRTGSRESQTTPSDSQKTSVKDAKIPLTHRVSKNYKKADAKIVQTTKKFVPQKTLHQLAANRAGNNGNLRFHVPVPRREKRIPIVVPGVLRHIRHAALPVALVAVLGFAFLSAGASPPSYISTKKIGGSGVDTVVKSMYDAYGNEYIVGNFTGTVDFGTAWGETETLTSRGGTDIFVTRISDSGTYEWTEHFGGSGNEEAVDIVAGSSLVTIVGNFTGTVDFALGHTSPNPITSAGGTDGFILGLNQGGSYSWSKRIGGSGADTITGIEETMDFGALVTGSFTDTVDFGEDWGETDSKTSAGSTDGFVLSITEAAEYVRTNRIGGLGADVATRAINSGYDNVVVTGSFTDTVDFGEDWGETDSKTSAGSTDGFVSHVAANDYQSTKQFGSTGADSGTALRLDKDENMYLAASFTDTVDFGEDWGETDSKTANSGVGVAIVKMSTSSYLWGRQLGAGESRVGIASIAVDPENNVYTGGSFNSTVDFASDIAFGSTDAKTSIGISSGYITQLDSAGGYGWTKIITPNDAPSAVYVQSLTFSQGGGLSIGGSFTGTTDFASDFSAADAKTANATDGFVTKIATQQTLHTIADATGLTFRDGEGANLSSTGTVETSPTVYIHDQDDETLLATLVVDLTENRDWSGISGDSDTGDYKMYVNNAIGAPGAAVNMTLHVLRNGGDNAVILCPGVENIVSVTKNCANKRTVTTHDMGVTTAEISGVEYWVIENITDQKIGGMSTGAPGVAITETDNSTAVVEGGAHDFVGVSLNAQPTDDVTVTLSVDPDSQIESIDPIIFTSSNWNTPVNVELSAVDDTAIEGDHSVSLGYTTASADTYYDGTTEANVVTVGITDNDVAGAVLQAASNLVSENGTSVEICIALTARPSSSVTLHLSSSDTAEVTVPGSITISPENWNGEENCFNATGADDDEADGPKNANISVTSITSDDSDFSGLDVETIAPVQVTNQDDDSAAFTVSSSDTITTEVGGTAEVCIKLTARPTSSITIPLAVSDASEGTLGVVTNLVIAPGSWSSNSNCVTITGVDDDIVDGDVIYNLVTGDPTSSDAVWDVLEADDIANQTLTNEDDDEAGIVVAETGGTTAVTEGGVTDLLHITLTSQPAPGKEVVVAVLPSAELDLGGGAGQVVKKTFTESDWNQDQAVTVTAVDDTKVEGSHSALISVSVDPATTETPYLGLAAQTVTTAITDNDIATASISTVDDAIENPSSNGRMRVSLDHSNNTGSDMVFDYTATGTAVSGTHYTALAETVTIADGASSADIIVDVSGRNNTLLEGDKAVIVTLATSSNPNAEISESNSSTSVTIFDDETAEIGLAATQNGSEDGPVGSIYTATLSKQNDTGAPVTVTINPSGGTAISGSDYEAFSGEQISIPNGSSTGTVTVVVIDDDDFEVATETVQATISNPSINAVSIDEDNESAEATITDNDTAELNITATQSIANENPSTNGTITFALDKVNNTGSTIEISYTISGTADADSDYDALSGTVAIAGGQQSKAITIDTSDHNDDDMEGPETVILTYASNNAAGRVSVGDNNAATVTVVDDEVAGITATAIDDTTSEDGGTGSICFALASRPSDSVTINLTSSDSSKVSVPATATIARNNWNNASANCVAVTGHDDTPPTSTGTQDIVIETTGVVTDDVFYAALSGGEIADLTIHHADNDSPGVIVSTVSGVTSEDGSKSAQLRFALRTQPSDPVTIPVTVSDETEGSLSVSQIVISPANWNSPEDNELTISGVDDFLTDGNITYQLVTSKPSSIDAAYDGLNASDVEDVMLTNEDDDEAGIVVTQTSGATAVAEGGANDTLSIALTSQPASGKEVVVSVDPDAELAAGEDGGEAVKKTFTESNWNVAQIITVTAVDDTKVEGDHSGSLVISIDDTTSESAYEGVDSQNISVAITDNDIATASIAKVSDAAENPGTNGKFKVSLDSANRTGEDMIFDYTVSGTATSGTHYSALSGTVAIPENSDEAEITIDVNGHNNTLLEGDKTVIVTLVSSQHTSGAINSNGNQSTVTIADDETATIALSVTQQGNEEDEAPIIYTATLSKQNDTGADITVAINPTGGSATKNDDYEDFSDATVTIQNGSSTGTISVPVIDDVLFEPETETVQAIISQSSSSQVSIEDADKSAEATITDNDTAQLNVSASQPDATENPSTNGTVTFTLEKVNNTGNAITINYAISGTATADSDYDTLSGAVSIPNGQQLATAVVDTDGHNDDDMEGDETVTLTYVSSSAGSRIAVDDDAATVTIHDDEIAAITINATDDTTSENGDTGQVCFVLSSRPGSDVVLALASSDSGKVSVPNSVTIERNDWSNSGANCATTTGHDDIPPEVTGTQDVVIQVTAITSSDPFYAALVAGDIDGVTMHHADNDTPGIAAQTVSDRTKEDGSTSAVVRFTLNTQPSDDVVIPLSVSDASEGSIAVVNLVITPDNWNNAAANEITINGVDDDLIDGDIAYTLVTGDPTSNDAAYDALGAGDVSNPSLTNDDDDVANISVTETDSATTVEEGGDTDTVTMQIGTQPADGTQVAVIASPANTEIDLGAGAGVSITLTFTDANWQDGQTITVSALDDTLLESDHTSQITYVVDNSATTELPYRNYADLPATTVQIADNDTATADLSLSAGSEAGPAPIIATVTLDKQNDTAEPITFSLNPNGGIATPINDYADFTNTTVNIPIGQSSASVSIPVTDDTLLEGDESVGAILSNSSLAAVTIATNQAATTITDNDTATATIVATDPTAAENPASSGEFTVYLSKANNTGAPITVNYTVGGTATSGQDYTVLAGSVNIAVGASSVVIPVATTGHDDSIVENSETVVVTLQDTNHAQVSIGGPASATVTIIDDDGFTTSIFTQDHGGEDGAVAIRYRVQLSQTNTTGSPVTVEISDSHEGSATSVEDYESFGGTVSIPDGQQYTDYTVTVIDDNDLENLYETVEAVVSNPSEGELGVASATATITDNDTAGMTIEATQPAAHENPATDGVFTITLDKPNHGTEPILITYTINGTATAGQDYAALSGTAMIASGQSDTVVTVVAEGYNDDMYEGDETVVVSLGSVDHPGVSIGEPSSATVTIADDDPEPQTPPVDNGDSPIIGSPTINNTFITTKTQPVRTPLDTNAAEDIAQSEQDITQSKPQPVDQKSQDTDSDGISDDEENKAHNYGDGNGDGIPDSQQDTVASRISGITNKPVTLEARGGCAVIEHFSVIPESKLTKQDKRHNYSQGLVDYRLACDEAGQSSTVTIYYDQIYNNPGSWRKFIPGEEAFTTLDFVNQIKQPVGKSKVTTASYIIRDGSDQDDDRKSNGKITDPAGFASRTFYIFDLGWAIPVLAAGWFIGYAAWHRIRDHRRYR
jgi:hypothetical protein